MFLLERLVGCLHHAAWGVGLLRGCDAMDHAEVCEIAGKVAATSKTALEVKDMS